MESFQFIPTSQKNIDQLISKKSSNLDSKVINWLIMLLIIYIIVVGVIYWLTIINEESKLRQAITLIDVKNSVYYPKGDLEQTLFNLNDLVYNVYNPISVIKSIEAAYIPNSRVKNFVYSKMNKSINFIMVVPSISDVTIQVQRFKEIKGITNVDFTSSNTVSGSSEASFNVTIRLN